MVWPVGSAGESATVGLGLTITEYSEGSPGHDTPPLANVAVTSYFINPGPSNVLVIFSPVILFPLFGEVNPDTFVVGLTGSNAAAVHAYVTPGKVTVDCKFTVADDVPEQMVCGLTGLAGNITPGFGLTLSRKGGSPGLLHPLAEGTMAKLTVAGAVPEFWNVSAIFPAPLTVAGEIPEPPVAVQE